MIRSLRVHMIYLGMQQAGRPSNNIDKLVTLLLQANCNRSTRFKSRSERQQMNTIY